MKILIKIEVFISNTVSNPSKINNKYVNFKQSINTSSQIYNNINNHFRELDFLYLLHRHIHDKLERHRGKLTALYF